MSRVIVTIAIFLSGTATLRAAFLDHIVVNVSASGLGYDSQTARL
ncbi:hypothetical protein BH11PLA2_BH11PLA2_12790 [soil metagenome]